MTRTVLTLISLSLTLLFTQSSLAASVNGKQCKAHLSNITNVMSNPSEYWNTRNHYPNMLSASLDEISTLNSDHRSVLNLKDQAKHVLNNCRKNCEGLRIGGGDKFQCKDLITKSIMDVFYAINNMEDDASGEHDEQAKEEPAVAEEDKEQEEMILSGSVSVIEEDTSNGPTKQECINSGNQQTELCKHHFENGSPENAADKKEGLQCLFDGTCVEALDPNNSAQ